MKALSCAIRLSTALAFAFGMANAAQAATCGIQGSASATPIQYDPFNPAGLPTTNITLTLTRVNTSNGGTVGTVNFYLRAQNNGADNTVIIPAAVAGLVSADGLGQNIFYNYAAPAPVMQPIATLPSATNRFLKINFTGSNAGSDTATVTFQVSLPANLDLSSTQNLSFDTNFVCTIQGGRDNGLEQQGSLPNALSLPITVLSALQASYAGSALNFGEVGDKSTQMVLAAPATYTTPANNNVSVRSSGPYSVSLTSQNQYRLTYPGGNLASADQRLNYQVRFLGQTLSNANPNFTSTTCLRAGVPAAEADRLSVVATLLEGGLGKLVAPNYNDTLTVTVTPLLSGAASQRDCPAL